MKILFPGSFDPITVAHENLVRRALRLFDEVVVAVGVNSDKDYMFSVPQRVEMARKVFENEPRVSVVHYSDMTVDCCHRVGAQCILRGVRNVKDMEYEQTVAAVNHSLAPDIETLILYADPDMVDVSSTVVRERLLHDQANKC